MRRHLPAWTRSGMAHDRLTWLGVAAVLAAVTAGALLAVLAPRECDQWEAVIVVIGVSGAILLKARGMRFSIADWFAGYASRAVHDEMTRAGLVPGGGPQPEPPARAGNGGGRSHLTPL